MIFDNSEYEDLIGGLQEQIKRKRDAQLNEYMQQTDFHVRQHSERQEKIYEDQMNLAIDKKNKRNAFLEAN